MPAQCLTAVAGEAEDTRTSTVILCYGLYDTFGKTVTYIAAPILAVAAYLLLPPRSLVPVVPAPRAIGSGLRCPCDRG
jgi:hypothetical protein